MSGTISRDAFERVRSDRDAWATRAVQAEERVHELEQRLATEGLPADLLAVLRDPSIVISQDAAVFELIAEWQNAPSNTASARPLPTQPKTDQETDPT